MMWVCLCALFALIGHASINTAVTMRRNLLARLGNMSAESNIGSNSSVGALSSALARSSATITSGSTSTAELTAKELRMHQWIKANKNPNTRRTYEAGWKGFERYLEEEGVSKQNIQAC